METLGRPTDVKQLQRSLNELVAILALPAIWTDLQPRQIASTLLDGLVQLLALEFGYIWLNDVEEGSVTECVRSSLRRDIDPHEVRNAFEPFLTPEPPDGVLALPNPVGDGVAYTALFRLGVQDEVGRLIIGSRRSDFPTRLERLLVQVATNQAVVGLQEARHLHRQRRTAEELVRSLERERAARLEAEKATRLSDEVLAIIAHDLRSPMNSILGAAELLEITAEQEKRQRLLAIVNRATRMMAGLVSDLLDIARIEAGNLILNTGPVDVGVLIRETVEMFEPQAVGRIELAVAIDHGLPRITGDRGRLVQVLSNLLGNALKFSHAETTITTRATCADGSVRVSVQDSGVGIPAEHLGHVFDRFWQADRTSRSGAGLGLAICKAIIEAHGGRIWATSVVGRGTTMYFELPV